MLDYEKIPEMIRNLNLLETALKEIEKGKSQAEVCKSHHLDYKKFNRMINGTSLLNLEVEAHESKFYEEVVKSVFKNKEIDITDHLKEAIDSFFYEVTMTALHKVIYLKRLKDGMSFPEIKKYLENDTSYKNASYAKMEECEEDLKRVSRTVKFRKYLKDYVENHIVDAKCVEDDEDED